MKLYKVIFLITASLFLDQALASSGTVGPKKSGSSHSQVKDNFKKVIYRLEKAILTLKPSIDRPKAKRLSAIIAVNSVKYKIDPRIILSVLNTESSFNQNAVSYTNDISIAQINLKVWTPKFFKEKTGRNLVVSRLKKDEAYAISRMCLILSYYKEKFPNDRFWFARYHSSTPKYKSIYLSKLMKNIKKIRHLGSNLVKEMPNISELRIALNNDIKNLELF